MLHKQTLEKEMVPGPYWHMGHMAEWRRKSWQNMQLQVLRGRPIQLDELLCALHQRVGEWGEQQPQGHLSRLHHCQPPGAVTNPMIN